MTKVAELLFGLALFVNAILFVPQAYRIIKHKAAKDISLVTFIGFWLIQLVTTIHGYLHQDHILFYGYILSMIACGTVIIAALIYRKN